MILLDALFINQGGGKVLLDLLVKSLENSGKNVFYLLDKRLEQHYKNIPKNQKIYLEGSYIKRHYFYKKHKNDFSCIFCFGNVPPSIYLNIPVYTYFHNILYFGTGKEYSLKERLSYSLRKFILIYTAKNTTEFWVQSNLVKLKMQQNLFLFKPEINIFPFFETNSKTSISKAEKNNEFMYLSNGYIHKNVDVLLKTWELLFQKGYNHKLHLTISSEYSELLEKIKNLQKNGILIENHGLVNPKILFDTCRYQIYPSLKESFGLGLIESVQYQTEIIGANLPYLTEVVNPLTTFNPYNADELCSTVIDILKNDSKSTFVSSLKVKSCLSDMFEKFNNC